MKRTLKKAFAFVLVLSMVCSSGIMAFAAEAKSSTRVQVQLNGEMIDFTDAVPKMVEGRVMVPFRSILEKVNAEVEYDQQKENVTAVLGDKSISFTEGSTKLQVKEGEKTENKEMDVAPFVDQKSNRIYVSTRSIAEAFGYSVGWDNANKAVIIIDFNKVFKDADKDFSYLSMPYETEYDQEKTYKTTGTLDGKVEVTSPLAEGEKKAEKINIGISGSYTGLQQMMNADLTMKLALNFDSLLKSQQMTDEDKALMSSILGNFKNLEMQIKMDDSGVMYMKSPIMSTAMGFLGKDVDKDTWYKMDMNEIYKEAGIDYQEIIDMSKGFAGNVNLADILTQLITGLSDTFTIDTYKDVEGMYAVAKELAGDQAFKTVGNTHTLTLDGKTFSAALSKYAEEIGFSKEEMKELQELDFSCTIQIDERNGKARNTKVKLSIATEAITMSMDMNGDALNSTCNLVMSIPDSMDIQMNAKAKSEVTTEKVDTSIPKDANVVDYMKMAESMEAAS